MASYTTLHPQILPNDEEPPHSTLIFRPSTRRTPSLSSSSSFDSSFGSSFNDEFPPYTPPSPLKFKGVPFSWEQIPGLPKKQLFKKKNSSETLLPLPPAGTTTSARRNHHQEEISPKKSSRFQMDPFFAALVECSKDDDDDHGSSKIARSLSGRFGLINMYTSCKRTCAVSDTIVYLPRSQQSPHCLLNRGSR